MNKITKNLISAGILLGVLTVFTSGVRAQSAAIVGPTFGCQGTPLILTVNVTGLTQPYTYSWSNGSTFSTQTLNFSALLRVDVTGTNANGAQQTVRSPFRLFLFLPAPNAGINVTGSTALCPGETATLTATGGNFGPTYIWSTGATTASIVVNAPGTYEVTISNFFGCTSSASQVITSASGTANINITGNTTLCPGETTILEAVGGTNGSTYSWSNGESTQNVTVGASGDYYVTITTGNCSATSDTVHIEVLDPGYAPSITASGPIWFCQPGCVTLSAPPGFSYQWSSKTLNATTPSVTLCLFGTGAGNAILDTETVALTVNLNNNLCSFNSKPIVCRSIREPELDAPFCPNLNMTLSDSVRAGKVLKYLTFKPEYEFEFEETTNPGVTWIYNNGSSSLWLKLGNVTPALQIGKYYNVRERAKINGVSYCFGNPCQLGITGPVINQPGKNSKLTNNSYDQLIEVNVYPNPSSNDFNVKIASINNLTKKVSVKDISGRVMEEQIVEGYNQNLTLGSNLSAGVYFIEVSQGNDYSQVTRIVKTN